ncbi:MAG: hypothetical protein JO040_07990 [Gemmatimonadetes bacterium]|nr:hypothetical protein [Gemmatimonadota bacterium]
MGPLVRTLRRGLAAAAVSTLAWSCAPASPPASSPGHDHAHMQGMEMAHAAGTPEAEAMRAYGQCGKLPAGAKESCYEPVVLGVLHASGIPGAVQTLDHLAMMDRDVKRDAHVYAHAIGIAAYGAPEEVGKTFAQCTPDYQSGCYHGVIQAYFMDPRRGEAVTEASVNALCRDYRADEKDRWLQFQCAHGMGHGLTMYYDHDLPRALRGCDLVQSGFEREACYQGAFMENVVNALMPHHPAAALMHGAHAGMEHGGMEHDQGAMHHGMAMGEASGPKYKALDPKDPFYPCNTVEDRYQSACWGMQTSAILSFNGQNVAETAGLCDRAPEKWRVTCFISLGRDVSGQTLQNRTEAIRKCALADTTYQPWCHVGAATNMLNVTAKAEDGLAYCREVAGEANKSRCYQAVGEQLLVLVGNVPGREQACATAEAGYVDVCRKGARLAAQAQASAK